MTPAAVRYLPQLEIIKKSSPEKRRSIIAKSDGQLIEAVSEICYNILRGNVKCGEREKSSLKRYKTSLRKLANGYHSRHTGSCDYEKDLALQRRVLMQKGEGFWLALLNPVVQGLASYAISKVLKI